MLPYFFGAHNDGTFLLDFVPSQMLSVDDKILSVFPPFEWGHWTSWHFYLKYDELRENCCGRTGEKKSKTLQEVLVDLKRGNRRSLYTSVIGKCEYSKAFFATTTFEKVFCNKSGVGVVKF